MAQSITIDGQSYELRYDFGAAEQFERETHKEYFNALVNPGAKTIKVLLMLGVKHAKPKITEDEAASMIQRFLNAGNNLGRLWKPIFEALKEAGLTAPEESTNPIDSAGS